MTAAPGSDEHAARFWNRTARRLAWRVNAAACGEHATTPALFVCALGAVALLVGRRQAIPAGRFALPIAGALLLCAIYAGWRARRGFFTTAAALVELDVALGLKARLTSAAAGVGPWPPIPGDGPRVVRWRVSRLLVPPGFAAALLLVAGFIPISKAKTAPPGAVQPPADWEEMDEWLKALQQEELARPEALEAWEERLSRLRQQPESVWYAHASLEAGDTLHQQLELGLRSMSEDLDEAADALEPMESVGGKGHDAKATGADAQLERALQRLEAGRVPLHPNLLSQLKSAQGAGRRSMSMAEIEKLRRRLREGAGFCRLKIRECEAGHKDCTAAFCRRGGSGKNNGKGRAAAGGVGRGPGEAPMMLSDDPSRTGSARLEGLSNEDMQHAALGDTLGTSRTGHEVDRRSPASLAAGGRVTTAPAGGEAVWHDALTPEEQRVLQRYFK